MDTIDELGVSKVGENCEAILVENVFSSSQEIGMYQRSRPNLYHIEIFMTLKWMQYDNVDLGKDYNLSGNGAW